MKAYLIVTLTVHDETMFAEYRKQVGDTAKPFGGQFLAAGGKATVLEGPWEHPGIVIVEFPSGLRGLHRLPGCGHWTQQERPQAVNDHLLTWLRGL